MTGRTLIPASESIIYGAISLDSNPTTTDAEVLSDPAVWQHTEYTNPADSGQRLIKVWRHDDTRPSGYHTRLYIIEDEETTTMQTTTTQEQYTPDQLEAIADLDRLTAYQDAYPEIYHQWYRKLINEPIDMAQRVYARLLHEAGTDGIAIKNAHKPIWMRETMPADQPETTWMILAAADRQFEYDWMGQLA